MKKIIGILLTLVLAVSFAACGSDTAQNAVKDETKGTESTDASADTAAVKEDIKTIVSNAVICTTKIFDAGTLEYEEAALQGNYHAVTSDAFKTYDQLEEFVGQTFVPELAEKVLTGKAGSPTVYAQVDGKLCIDLSTVAARGYYVDWSDYDISIKDVDEAVGKCTFTVTAKIVEPGDDPQPEDYPVEASAAKVDGKWLLETVIR